MSTGNKLVHECLLLSEERIAVAHGTAEDTTDDVTCLGIARQLSVGDGESDGTDVVGNYTHGDVLLLIFAVLLACHISDSFQYRLEYVGIVVGGLSLQSAHQTLEAHAGVDNLGGKPFEAAVRLAVELHEHEVPDFNHLRVVFVHQLAPDELWLLLLPNGSPHGFPNRGRKDLYHPFPRSCRVCCR